MPKSMDLLNRAFLGFRIFAAVVTALLLIALHFTPPKHLQLHPAPKTYLLAYSDNVEPGGKTDVEWVDPEAFILRCNVREGEIWRYCGLSLKMIASPREDPIVLFHDTTLYEDLKSIDLSRYDYISIDMDYDGPEERLRIFLRNALEAPPTAFDQLNEHKFMSEFVTKAEMDSHIDVLIDQFSVADWWVAQFDVPRQDASPEFNKIFEIGIDFPDQPQLGEHILTVRKITAVGNYFHKESIHFGIIISWLIIGFFEFARMLVISFLRQKKITSENSHLRAKMVKDPLTGLANRYGIEHYVSSRLPAQSNELLYCLMIDLDHFKTINDQFGHHIGDQVLKETSVALQRVLRKSDLLGRWGGEEFLIICDAADSNIDKLIQRLREELATVVVKTPSADVLVTMSIGVSQIGMSDTFETVLQRADQAAYDAKAAGRNTWKVASM